MDKKIYRIAISGGPCAGKTTALSILLQKLQDFGCRVIIVPELAAELLRGKNAARLKKLSLAVLQHRLLKTQLLREDRYYRIARRLNTAKKIVILVDRGVMDGEAYCSSKQEFDRLIKKAGYNRTELYARYDTVVHLVTAAEGAPEFYIPNDVRKETPEEARALDKKTRDAWVGHSCLRVIPNTEDGAPHGKPITFERKMQRLLAVVCRAVGIPVPIEDEKKYVVALPDFDSITRDYSIRIEKVEIEQAYLKGPRGVSRRIRKRGQGGHFVYYYSEKIPVRPGVKIENGRHISARTYSRLFKNERHPECRLIKKDRYCFVWRGQYFELDVFKSPPWLAGLCILELERTEDNDVISIPPFIRVIKEATQNEAFSNRKLSKRRPKNI